MEKKQKSMTYAGAGVDINAGNTFADMIKERVRKQWPEVAAEIGGFAGTGDIPKEARRIAASTDGTGTVAILAALNQYYAGIGYNAVAMGAVDTFVQGYRPEYLLDSLDVARLVPKEHIKIIDSIIEGCKLAGCKLIGGETAELPDMFKYDWMFNLNVAVVGFPDPKLEFIPVEEDHDIWGWRSYGPGSNGFSLLRKVHQLKIAEGFTGWLRKVLGLNGSITEIKRRLDSERIFLEGKTLGEALLTPTPIYIKNVYKAIDDGVNFSGHAHITGGGFDNVARALPKHLKAVIYRDAWKRPGIFRLTQEVGQIKQSEMDRVFNNGIIMVSFIPKGQTIKDENAVKIGYVDQRETYDHPQVELRCNYMEG